jgi:hypothetical protein
MIQNGNLPLLFTKNWLRLAVAEATKQRRVSTICDWNIFFGRIDGRGWFTGSARSVSR